MATEVEIWNMALAYLKAGAVTTVSDNSAQARALAKFADNARMEVLRKAIPPFAQKVSTLTESSDTNYSEYNYLYDLPTDYIRVLEILDESYYKYEPQYKVDGAHLYLDYSPGIIRYIYDQSDYTQWDSLSANMMALYLAAQTAPVIIPGGLKYQQQYLMLFERKMIEATGIWNEENINHDYNPDKYNEWW